LHFWSAYTFSPWATLSCAEAAAAASNTNAPVINITRILRPRLAKILRKSGYCRKTGRPASFLQKHASNVPGRAFARTRTVPLQPLEGIVYGPVRSRRLGFSLGINLLPSGAKVCNMDCAYCQYGWTRNALRYRGQGSGWPSPQAVEAAVAARLMAAAERDESIDRLTVAGHGEPTLHPEFEEVASRLHELRVRIAPLMPLTILSNSTTAAAPEVRRGLKFFDERYMKLDAGDSATFAMLNGGGRHLSDIVDALRTLSPIVIQAMFVRDSRGQIDNTHDTAINEWLMAVETIAPVRVQVYTLDRAPALESLEAVPPRRLREIAERVRSMGIPTDVFLPRSTRRRTA
jgi:wyosine [tRNA(Phe)-imidazoG37] synthetase (radical SAM superfamily)